MPDISQIRNVTSGAISQAERTYRSQRVANDRFGVYGKDDDSSFQGIFQTAVKNLSTTNAYLSDAENEEIRWALGETNSTHDLTIALQKAQVALQYTVALRDRFIAAYREIIQMQI